MECDLNLLCYGLLDAPILDVGLLTIAGVRCEASDQLAHS
jgi:hypothetical protein